MESIKHSFNAFIKQGVDNILNSKKFESRIAIFNNKEVALYKIEGDYYDKNGTKFSLEGKLLNSCWKYISPDFDTLLE
jgi:hypothetical protein